MTRAFFTLLMSIAVACGWGLARARAEPPIADNTAQARDFDERVAPLLARRCLACHNPSDNKGELDLTRAESVLGPSERIVPGQPDESYLWERIASDEMPPKTPLDAAEKKLLRDWIAAGATWGQNPIDRFRYSSDARAGHDWWSLQPVARPATPAARSGWPRNPIDQFVLAQLAAHGLEPSAEADRRTLARRLFFDLTGLPPTPQDVAAFVADRDPSAYEKLVDRLLAAPEYGERWARHWLDLARFAESNGFEYDEPRRNAWPYRDWVVDALNRDLAYDEFARQQLAGDVLAPSDREAIKATGFLVAGAFDTVGQKQQSQAMKAVVRQDELEDIVSTVGQTFLGLTVHCARCHDHKFDPIRQTEYYQLAAALDGVRHGERNVTPAAEEAALARRAAELHARVDAVQARIHAIEQPIRTQVLAQRKGGETLRPAAPTPLARWEFDQDLQDRVGHLHAKAQGGAVAGDGGLHLDGRSGYVATAPLEKDLRAKTLEVWLSLDNLRQAGGGAIGVQTLDGKVFDAIVFGEREPGRWLAGSDNFSRELENSAGPPEDEAAKRTIHVALVYSEDGAIKCYRNGHPYGRPYDSFGPVTFKAGEAQVLFGLRHSPASGKKLLAGVISRAQLYDRALSAEEVAVSAGAAGEFVAQAEIAARLAPEALSEHRRLTDELSKLQAQQTPPPKQLCYAVAPREPEPSHVLVRGDVRQAGPIVSPGGVASLGGVNADFGLPPDAPDGQRRAALARWITSPRNPLFARVAVNRLWHYHFGSGLAEMPNDFGFNGGRPTHAQLLDWLAATLVERNWSLKQLHREIVLSATYRQDSKRTSPAAERDADNRWLWRKSPQRLEAEAVRDAMLSVAGQLHPKRGGPGFADCTEVLRAGTYTFEPSDPVGEEFNRRSIYRVWFRGGRSGLLDAFDCPDPSTIAPKRAVTTTPLQALTLLNNAFVLRMADRFAERIAREAGADVDGQVARAYQLAYGRDPVAEEAVLARQTVGRHGLGVLARAIFNSNEFLYID